MVAQKMTREARARMQFHDYTYTLGHVRVLMTEREARVPVVTVRKKKDPAQGYAVAFLPDGPTCSCPDQLRHMDQNPDHECKHIHCSKMWLTGEVPPLPAPDFDMEREGAILAKLEQSERIERARRDAAPGGLWD